MTEPTEHDVAADGSSDAAAEWREAQERGGRPWPGLFGADVFDLESVRATVLGSGYPAERLHLVQGEVEQTLPRQAPTGPIALLRLDTDWYRSTLHELHHLYPRLVDGGVLIIDDYGHWQGARQAVDEFLATVEPVLLQRIDYTGRLALKPG